MNSQPAQPGEDHPQTTSELAIVRGLIGGFLMGLANLVPGISGGTMLLATGVYPRFIRGVAEVTTFHFRLPTLVLLGCIVVAALTAFFGLAGPMTALVVEQRWIMYSIFIGLTLGGVPLLWSMLRPASIGAFVGVAIGIAGMAAIAFVNPGEGSDADGHSYLMYGLAGLAAASAMVLPGISGSYLLLVMGQYIAVLGAASMLKDGLVDQDWTLVGDAMHIVIPVGIGVVVGIATVSNVVKFLLEHVEKPTLGALLGLLLGSVLGLWPFQRGVAPDVGSTFRGDTVIERDGELLMQATGRLIEPADYPTALFAPTAGEITLALMIAAAAFGLSWLVAHIGREKPTHRPV